ncbi:MAG: PqqD family peptide modification chaperone [Clostridia bacterium]|nr:PqqD family peptide modification chaperone [Clostridia bacterium]
MKSDFEDGFTKVFNPSDGKNYTLNKSASGILHYCDGLHSISEIRDRISKATGIEADEVYHKLQSILTEIYDKGLIWIKEDRLEKQPVSPPITCYWDLSTLCNLSCKHCAVEGGDVKTDELDTKECLNVVNQLASLGELSLVLSGGEPLLRKDFFEIARYAKFRGMDLQLATNATVLDARKAREIKRLDMSVQVSLDGSNPEIHDAFRGKKGAFKAALRGISFLRKERVPFTIGFVVNKSNMHDMEAAAQLAVQLGAENFRVISYVSYGRGKSFQELEPTPQEFKWIAEKIVEMKKSLEIPVTEAEFEFCLKPGMGSDITDDQHFGCGGALGSFSITANGDVLPCSFFEGIRCENVREYPLAWIWENSPLFNYFRDLKSKDIKGSCKNCQWFLQCNGSCPAANFAYGKMLRPHVHCWIAEENK